MPGGIIGVVRLHALILPEFIRAKWWQHLLHNQTALLIKGALPLRKNTSS